MTGFKLIQIEPIKKGCNDLLVKPLADSDQSASFKLRRNRSIYTIAFWMMVRRAKKRDAR